MDFTKRSAGNVIFFIVELLIGILLLINPLGFTSVILIVAGTAAIVLGITFIIKYFRTEPEAAALSQNFVIGLVSVAAGAFCIIKNAWIVVRALPILTVIYGIAILVSGFKKAQVTVDMLRLKYNKWGWSLLGAVIYIVCAVVIIGNPFATTYILWKFIGATMIVGAVVDLIALIFR